MINAAMTKKKLDNLANQVERRDPGTAAHLRDLGEGVVGGPTADVWAFSNIRSVLDPDRIANALVGDASNDMVARGLEFLRNSMVLLPLAITWFGIALAVDAYYKLVASRPELAGQSFIYLWQGGFQGRMPLPLGTLAVIDALLLAGVFALTLAAYARSAWLALTNTRYGVALNRDISAALAEAELILAPRRGAQYFPAMQKLEENAEGLLNEIAQERERISQLAQKREHELADLSGITDNLKNSSVVFLNASQSLANTHTATLAALNGLMGTLKGMTATQQDVMKAVHSVARRVDGLVPQMADVGPRSAEAFPGGRPESLGTSVTKMDAGAARAEGLIAGQQYGVINLMIEQQRALQDTLRKIDSLIVAQQASMESLLVEQRDALRRSAAQAGGTSPAPGAEPKVVAPPGNVPPVIPRPPETSRK